VSRPPEVPPEIGGPSPTPGHDLVPVTPPPPPAEPGPGVMDLVTRTARVGMDAASLLVTEVAEATVKAARAVLPPVVAQGPLDTVGEQVDRRRAQARRREATSRDEAGEAMQAVIGRVVEMVIDQLDMSALIQRIPIDEVIDNLDIEAIVDKIDIKAIVDRIDIEDIVAGVDIGAIVRDSTTGLAGETVDALRVQVMGIDLFAARVVDKILRRKAPRVLVVEGYDVYGPEIRLPREMR
jgi:hypothetical protein